VVDAPPRRRPQFHPLRVARVEKLTDDAVAVTFEVPVELAEDYAFRPGQALTLRRVDGDRDERRSYSICAPVGAAPRVGVREVPGGFFSSWLVHQVRPGDEVEVLPPSGTFTADLSTPADHVFVVAGSGITPALSLAGSVLRDGESTVTVLYGNRRTDTVMFADELADLKDRYGPRRARVRGGRVRHHAGVVAGLDGPRGREFHGHRLLRQPPDRHGDVRRRPGRPEGPARPPPHPGACPLPRAA